MVKTSSHNQKVGERGDILKAFRHSEGIKELWVWMVEPQCQRHNAQKILALCESLMGLISCYTALLVA